MFKTLAIEGTKEAVSARIVNKRKDFNSWKEMTDYIAKQQVYLSPEKRISKGEMDIRLPIPHIGKNMRVGTLFVREIIFKPEKFKRQVEKMKKTELLQSVAEKNSLLKELSTDAYKYDIRFWPNNKITEDAIRDCVKGRIKDSIRYECMGVHRIDYVLKTLYKLGVPISVLYSVMLDNYKKKIKELADDWWRELNSFYRKCVEDNIINRDFSRLKYEIHCSKDSYSSYAMFMRYIEKKPLPIPQFIITAKNRFRIERRRLRNVKTNC